LTAGILELEKGIHDYSVESGYVALYVGNDGNLYLKEGDNATVIAEGVVIVQHGSLLGLGNDDHTQYLNTTRGDERYYRKDQSDSIYAVLNNANVFTQRLSVSSLTNYHAFDYLIGGSIEWYLADYNNYPSFSKSLYVGTHKVLDESDYGHGNAIDADTLDTYHASHFAALDDVITDHGDLSGLDNDDHTQYVLKYQLAPGDLNNITDTGFYIVTNDLNAPSNRGHVMSIKRSDSYYTQIFYNRNTTAVYTRVYNVDTWSDWSEFYHTGNVGPGSGLDADTVDGIEGDLIVQGDNNTRTTGLTTSSDNIDLIRKSGFYYVRDDFALGSHPPGVTKNYFLVVHQNPLGSNYSLQTAYTRDGNKVFYRYLEDDVWSDWIGLFDTINLNLGRFEAVELGYENTNSPPNDFYNNSGLRVKGTKPRIMFHQPGKTVAGIVMDYDKLYFERWMGGYRYEIFHEGNMGDGSGLNADRVDGIEADAIVYGSSGNKTSQITSVNNSNLKSGFYYGVGGITGSPTNASYHYIISRYHGSSNYQFQLACNASGVNQVFVRSVRNGTYDSWEEFYHTGNLNPNNVSGNLYIGGNCSAASFTDRTPYPDSTERAISALRTMKKNPNKRFGKKSKAKSPISFKFDEKGEVGEDQSELDYESLDSMLKTKEGKRDLSMTVSSLVEVVKHLLDKVEYLEEELKKRSYRRVEIREIIDDEENIVYKKEE